MALENYWIGFNDVRVVENAMVYNQLRVFGGMHPLLAGVGFPIPYPASQLRYVGTTWGMYVFPPLVIV